MSGSLELKRCCVKLKRVDRSARLFVANRSGALKKGTRTGLGRQQSQDEAREILSLKGDHAVRF